MRPVLMEDEDVKLGIPLKEDLQRLFEIYNNPAGSRFLRNPSQIFYYEDIEDLYGNMRSEKQINRLYVILFGKADEIVGSIGLYGIDLMNRFAYLAFGIDQNYWRRGITTRAVSLMITYAFETMDLRKIISSVMDPNIGSKRVLEKNGFEEAGRYRKHGYVPGYGFVDEILYEKFNEKAA
ncbi:MAG: GNAT family N-acetyltransferase [Thermoplasmata archaeon]